jgi:predicted AlkP superfamily phosphohydrolase/phosphomutase
MPLILDIDSTNDVARIKIADQAIILRQGEWSDWLTVEFPLIPHLSSVRGIVRIFAKQLHPGIEIYISPINLDPSAPALPVSSPSSWARNMEADLGAFSTLGIPEDTSALRQEVLDLPQFRQQAELILKEESNALDFCLRQFKSGFLFFYFSSIDQNSHILWGKHDQELLKVYREVDRCVGTVRLRQPDAELLIISDHGFTTFDRALHLNSWLRQRGFLATQIDGAIDWAHTEAYAMGLNGLYLNLQGREHLGTVSKASAENIIANLRNQLLAFRDPVNANVVIETVATTHPSSENRNVAPDLIIGYARGYRASWQTGLGQVPTQEIEDNNDAWIADHCINPADVPGVLFSSKPIRPISPTLPDVTASILKRFGLPPPKTYQGHMFY